MNGLSHQFRNGCCDLCGKSVGDDVVNPSACPGMTVEKLGEEVRGPDGVTLVPFTGEFRPVRSMKLQTPDGKVHDLGPGEMLTVEVEAVGVDWDGPAEEASEKRRMGSLAYQAQHQQNPQKREGKFFDREKIHPVTAHPVGIDAIRYFDLASTTDEAGCATVGVLMAKDADGRYYVLHATLMHEGPFRRNQEMRLTGEHDMRRTGIKYRGLVFEKQPAAAGVDQAEEIIRTLAPLPVRSKASSGDKFVRAEGLSAQWDGGNVYVVEGDWNGWFFDQMESFGPDSPAELLDVGDACSGAFNELAELPNESGATGTTAATSTPPSTRQPRSPRP